MNQLIGKARSARNQAYAPYSNYKVGAALRTVDGGIFTGANIEFANFTNTLHAEEVAIAKAVQEGQKSFDTIAVSTENGATPCGLCRQSLAEFDEGSMTIIVDDGNSATEYQLSDLLPLAFTEEEIG